MKRILDKYVLSISSGLCLVIVMMVFNACDRAVIEDDESRRTILFYIGSDNNQLDNGREGNEPGQKIDEIRRGWQPGKGEMLIYTDQTNQDACLLRISDNIDANGMYALDTLGTYTDDNTADAEVLKRVIKKVVNDYPADSYGMIIFSHGTGWLPEGMYTSPRSLFVDNEDGQWHEMEIAAFASAIPDGLFDFIILEACLMADVCLMYELRNKTEYVLASSAEIIAKGFTYIYTENIMGLFNTKQSLDKVIKDFAYAYSTNYNSFFTVSILKMSEMDALAEVTKTVLQGMEINEDNLSVSIGEMQRFDRPNAHIAGSIKRPCFFDLGHTIENIVSDYSAFSSQLEKTVIWKASTASFLPGQSGFNISYHSGLTTYIEQAVYPELNAKFKNSKWYQAILPE